ncbi:MAG: hypothetical protein Q8R81_09650 [Novosphingobium sp.]|uniref:hypothetical protein n=1 Tax=Novosphingobium sp. TaxID=1874826 RepID=UPI002736323B|nr:hypothetical protein [Novosphingobium sp.]MDP3550649.1 hypothetical protein [Novosphingobium sp.]
MPADAQRNPRRTLISDKEIARAFKAIEQHGIDITGFGIDIRTDGIAFLPPAATPAAPEDPFSAWKTEEQNRDRRPRRS